MLESIRPIKVAAALVGLLLSTAALSQSYPSMPIRLIVGFTPGGTTDQVARLIATQLGNAMGQPVVVDNKPGGAGTLATAQVARAKADGYTLLLATTSSISIAPFLYKTLPYRGLPDFAPITLVARVPQVLVMHPGVVNGGLNDMVQLAKKSPAKYAYGSPGSGTSPHLAMEAFKQRAQIDVTHVPYKGSGPAESDVIAGHIALAMDPLQAALPYIRAGKTQALAITSDTRSQLAPEIPTFAELGYPGLGGLSAWYGVMAPVGVPDDVARTLSAAIEKIVRAPDMQAQLLQLGAEPLPLSGPAFAKFLQDETGRWSDAVRISGAKVD